MLNTKFKNYRIYYSFLNALAKELTRYYYKKLDRPFKVMNKSKRKRYDPVTQADREFEKFIRARIKKRFPTHQVIGEEFCLKKSNSDYTWVIDPIDGTRSFTQVVVANQVAIVEWLLKNGVRINAETAGSRSALDIALTPGFMENEGEQKVRAEITRLLRQHGGQRGSACCGKTE